MSMRNTIIIIFFLGLALSAHASGNKIRVTGVGYAAGGDLACARDVAISDAKIRAVESVCGTEIDARTLLHNTLMIDDTVSVRAKGRVRSYTIVDEKLDETLQLYYVTIEAVVDRDTLDSGLVSAAGKKRLLFLRKTSQDQDRYLTRKLEQLFDQEGFTLSQASVDGQQFDLLDAQKAAAILKAKEKDILIAYEVGIHGIQCMTSNYCAARAGGFIRLYAPFRAPGEPPFILDRSASSVKGFGCTKDEAGRQTLKNLSDELLDRMMSGLAKTIDKDLKIQVLDLPDYRTFKVFKKRLSAFRWVISVKEDSVGYHPVKSVFIVRYREDREGLAALLESLDRYEFQGRSKDVYTLRYLTAKEL